MSTKVESLVEQAKQLSPEEQALLADAIHELISPPTPEWEAQWIAECEDRLAAYERGDAIRTRLAELDLTEQDIADAVARARAPRSSGEK